VPVCKTLRFTAAFFYSASGLGGRTLSFKLAIIFDQAGVVMRYLVRLLELVLLVLLVAVTVQNSAIVEFKLFFGQSWNAPLILLLLVFFVAGVLIAMLATFTYSLRVRRELSQLKKELRSRQASSRVTKDPSDALAD
jgi:putative membrane protein